jgi:hypothetical protein
VVSSSSTRKAARLAQKGKGKRVRFQGGTLFPLIVTAILVIGLGTIVYARQSQPKADASPPTIDNHWHIAYGFQLCDADNFTQLTGNLEEVDANGQLVNTDYLRTGVHTHDDGVIHWHAFTAAAVGNRAKLGVFLENYGVELTDEALRFPENQGGEEYVEGETTCGDEDAELRVVVWENYQDTDDGTTYTSDFNDIRIDRDGMAITIAFVPSGTDVVMPPWAAQLPELGVVDQDQTGPPGATVPGTTPGGTTPGGTTPGGTTPDGTTPDGSTVPTGSAPTGTAAPPATTTPPSPASTAPPATG